jgi:hypothetical protein
LRSGAVRSRTPPALQASATRDRIGRPARKADQSLARRPPAPKARSGGVTTWPDDERPRSWRPWDCPWCPLATAHVRCQWHGSGTAGKNDLGLPVRDGHRLGRRVRPVHDDHLPRCQGLEALGLLPIWTAYQLGGSFDFESGGVGAALSTMMRSPFHLLFLRGRVLSALLSNIWKARTMGAAGSSLRLNQATRVGTSQDRSTKALHACSSTPWRAAQGRVRAAGACQYLDHRQRRRQPDPRQP